MKKVLVLAAALGLGSPVAMAQPVQTGIVYNNIIGQITLTKKGNLCKVFSITDGNGWRVVFAAPDDAFWTSVIEYDNSGRTVRVAWSDQMHYTMNCPDPYGSSNMLALPIPNAIIRQDEVR